MTNLDKMNFANLSQEEMTVLQQAEDVLNKGKKSDTEKVYLMALINPNAAR